ncbi:MAG: glycosyl transferase [Flavobacteriaceae bacterium]|nr:MAG: glycosyl transferase [Flavobacteriaceae bacterium]
MKILHLINTLGAGGAEKLLVDSAITYQKMGVNVDILLLKGGTSPFKHKLKNYPKINLFDLGENTKLYSPINIIRLIRYFKEYDIVHVHLFPSLYWASLANVFSNSKRKLIFTEHNVSNRRRQSIVSRVIDNFIYKQYSHIITVSDAAYDSLRKHLNSSFNNIKTISNGIDLEEIKNSSAYFKSELGFTNEIFLLIQISSFTDQKGQKALIKALNHLNEDIHLLLVGDGPTKEDCINLTKELNVSERVHFLGIRSDVPKLLKTADIVILSSFFEGLSLASIEGLASGKPFIASDVPGLTNIVENAGILFPVNDYKKLASIIQKLQFDKDLYKSTIRNCEKRAEQYNIINMADKYIKLYNKCYNDR